MILLKKIMILLMFTAAFAACKKETKNVLTCNEFKVEKKENTCNSYTFIAKADNYNPYWNVYTAPNDTQICYGKASSFDFNPSISGKYTVEAVYENISCPNGIKVTYDIIVLEDCFQDSTSYCGDFEVEVKELSCYNFSVETNRDNPFWLVDGVAQNNNQSNFSFTPKAAGTYEIKVGYVNQNCPDSVIKEVTIEVKQDCFKDIVVDCDGNRYKTVAIGTQVWMAENLKATKYNDCTPIELAEDSAAWVDQGKNSLGLYSYYRNDPNKYANTNGALYNWHAVNTGDLCPTGWHVPSETEWTTLSDYLSSQGLTNDWFGPVEKGMGTALKSTDGWNVNSSGSNGNGTDAFGWNGLPGGHRNQTNHFFYMDDDVFSDAADYWSSSLSPGSVWHWNLSSEKNFTKSDSWGKTFGISVRCLKN